MCIFVFSRKNVLSTLKLPCILYGLSRDAGLLGCLGALDFVPVIGMIRARKKHISKNKDRDINSPIMKPIQVGISPLMCFLGP